MNGLTRQQLRAFVFIETYIGEHGHAPAYTDMMAALGQRSKCGIHRLVRGLVARGYITYNPRLKRSIQVVRHQCPHCGGSLAQTLPEARAA